MMDSELKESSQIRYAEEAASEVIIPHHVDIAGDLYEESLSMDPDERVRLARSVLLKLDLIVLPMMCFIYFLSFLDKSALNYANAYGLQKDLHMHGRDYSWVASIANFGYLVGAYPMVLGLQKLPIGRFIGCMVAIWGIVLSCTAASKNESTLLALRFILGFAEAGIGPAWLLITSMFWTKDEAPLRMSFWLGINGLSQMIGSGISWGLGHTSGTLAPWKLVFLVIGLLSAVAGFLGMLVLPSSPGQTIFLSRKEAAVAVWRVRQNNIGIKNDHVLWSQVVESLSDPKTYLFALCGLCLGMLNGAISNFLTTLLKSFGFSDLKSVLYQIPGGAFQFLCTVSGGLIVTKVPNALIATTVIAYLPGLGAIVGILLTPLTHQIRLAACAWLLPITGLAIILTWNIVATNTAGHTKRTFTNGVEFTFYAAGNIVSPFFFLPQEAPRYPTAIRVLVAIYAAGIVSTSVLGLYMWWQNMKRRKLQVDPVLAEDAGFRDCTDLENKGFLYKL